MVGKRSWVTEGDAAHNALLAHLERREEILPSTERVCPCCGEARCVIGYEKKEVFDLEPASYFVRVIKRESCTSGARAGPENGPKDVNAALALW